MKTFTSAMPRSLLLLLIGSMAMITFSFSSCDDSGRDKITDPTVTRSDLHDCTNYMNAYQAANGTPVVFEGMAFSPGVIHAAELIKKNVVGIPVESYRVYMGMDAAGTLGIVCGVDANHNNITSLLYVVRPANGQTLDPCPQTCDASGGLGGK